MMVAIAILVILLICLIFIFYEDIYNIYTYNITTEIYKSLVIDHIIISKKRKSEYAIDRR